jgi:hypothetical protein
MVQTEHPHDSKPDENKHYMFVMQPYFFVIKMEPETRRKCKLLKAVLIFVKNQMFSRPVYNSHDGGALVSNAKKSNDQPEIKKKDSFVCLSNSN